MDVFVFFYSLVECNGLVELLEMYRVHDLCGYPFFCMVLNVDLDVNLEVDLGRMGLYGFGGSLCEMWTWVDIPNFSYRALDNLLVSMQ